MLTEREDGHEAVRLIAINRVMRAEVEGVLPVLRRAAEPASLEWLLVRLGVEAPTYGIPDREPELWAALFAPYTAALGQLPPDAINEAFLRWARAELYPKEPGRHAFYPKPAELFTLAQPTYMRLKQAAWRAQRALEYVDRLPPQALTAEQVAQRRRDAIAAGVLDENGKVIFQRKPFVAPAPKPTETSQQLADRLRATAAAPRSAPGIDDCEEAV